MDKPSSGATVAKEKNGVFINGYALLSTTYPQYPESSAQVFQMPSVALRKVDGVCDGPFRDKEDDLSADVFHIL